MSTKIEVNKWIVQVLNQSSNPLLKDEVFKSGMLVNPQCGCNNSWNFYTSIEREGGGGSKAWWLEPLSKETDKGPEDSCSAALSLTKRNTGTMLKKKYLYLKFSSKPRHGKGK